MVEKRAYIKFEVDEQPIKIVFVVVDILTFVQTFQLFTIVSKLCFYKHIPTQIFCSIFFSLSIYYL